MILLRISKCYFFCFGLLHTLLLYGQEGIAEHRTLFLRDSSHSMKVQILNTPPAEVNFNNGLTYYYHYKDAIHQSQGGYTGSLLDGTWESQYPNNLLYSQGMFEKGLKSGIWHYWYPNGRLQREEHWKEGRLHGSFIEFNTNGQPTEMGRYRHGLLHGTVVTLDNGITVEKTRYHKGKIAKKFSFPKIFKRKKAQADETSG